MEDGGWAMARRGGGGGGQGRGGGDGGGRIGDEVEGALGAAPCLLKQSNLEVCD